VSGVGPRDRPLHLLALLWAAAAGALAGDHWLDARTSDCRHRLEDGRVEGVRGRFLGWPGEGGAPFRVEGGLPGGCRGEVRSYLGRGRGGGGGERRGAPSFLQPGVGVEVVGRWRSLPPRDPTRPEWSGYLVVEEVRLLAEEAEGRGLGAEAVALRGRVQERLRRLFPRRAAVAEALLLARKEGLDPEVRDAFARSGTAHLLAISGFHVGIAAGLLFGLGLLVGLGPRRAPLFAAAGAWAYVLWIGAPDAALRAALLLSLLALGRPRGAAVLPLGGLATAFIALLLADPGALLRPGFQLSFAGTAGLLLWLRPTERALVRAVERARRRLGGGGGETWGRTLRLLLPLASPAAASVAATLATLPLVAWHFGRVPVVGIPATLLTTPLIALAIPGLLATLLLDAASPLPGPVSFLAGGVELLLDAAVAVTGAVAALPGAAPWVPRSWVPAGFGGLVLGAWVVRRSEGMKGWRRRVAVGAWVAAGVIAAPVAEAVALRGTVEIAMLDVGQGDAIALRSPAGRWLLVDAGPRTETYDAGERRVVPWLRGRGVERLEALVLTHADLDHLGGAPAVLAELDVGAVLDPGVPMPGAAFADVLEAAEVRGVGWWRAEPGERLHVDGMELRVLHAGPPPEDVGEVEGTESNAFSVVFLLEFGRFRALLTGDAPRAVERWVVSRLQGPVTFLKVGHHGSHTSTGAELLEAVGPEVAAIPVGARNRYGHPHREVLERLRGAGVRVYRTDRHGTVVLRARRDGSWRVEVEREGAVGDVGFDSGVAGGVAGFLDAPRRDRDGSEEGRRRTGAGSDRGREPARPVRERPGEDPADPLGSPGKSPLSSGSDGIGPQPNAPSLSQTAGPSPCQPLSRWPNC